jgi:hypothetical protein
MKSPDTPHQHDPHQQPAASAPQVPVDTKTTTVNSEGNAPSVVQMIRPIEPPKQVVSAEALARHEDSRKKYPTLNLSEGEYVIRAMHRHPIGLFLPMAMGTILLALTLIFFMNYDIVVDYFDLRGAAADSVSILLPTLLFCGLVLLGMYVAYYVYFNNKFFLTNESVIQEIQDSIFSKHEQTVSLGNIEDASYLQTNIIEYAFHYGSIRLSTEGDETTYRFTYVSNPKEHIATLNNAVEAFKLGRPVTAD